MLDGSRFTEIGAGGIGNPRSLVAQSMAWYDGHVYLGVTHPTGEGPDDAARILRYDVRADEWEVVYESPLVQADENAIVKDVYRGEGARALGKLEGEEQLVPQYRGFRCMAVFQKKGDDRPVLFASTLSHWGSQLIASEDGRNFRAVCEPGLGDPDTLSFRSIITFKNKLFVSPVGSVKEGVMDRNFGDVAKLFVSDDPLNGGWEEAMPHSFGDATNLSVFCTAVYNDQLYAGTGNPERGFELWRTDAEGKPPYKWTRVMTRGAERFNVNETTASMTAFNGALYVGSGLPGLGYDKAHDVGPAAAELIRVHADDSWELLVGASRFTTDGLKVPLSLMGPGYDDHANSALWAMAAYKDAIYVGTHHCQAFHDALGGAEHIGGGFQLWTSQDGEHWEAVTMDGFDDPFATGVRTLLPTPVGLFLGTSTHREIQRLWTKRTGMPIQREGTGLSVWLGR
ncbi:MAG: hypothetical protein AAF184_06280 [Pseudomonadota bacterium]